jgi:flagellar basal-body rod protein FlgC
MELFKSMDISASGLQAQRVMVNTISTNLANVHTTRTPEGGPYRRKQAIFSSSPHSRNFPDLLSFRMGQQPMGVKAEVVEDTQRKGEMIYDPSHPDADESGVVSLPNVNVVEEMVALLGAMRSYEANVTAFNTSKQMAMKSLDIGK